MQTPRLVHGATTIGTKIYVVGGLTNGFGVTGSIEEYDVTTDRWTTKATMLTPRWGAGVAAVGGKVHAIGGTSLFGGATEVPLKIVEQYDPATNLWTTKASMPTARYNGGIVAVNGKIYVIGGNLNPGFSSTVEEYDPATDSWRSRQNMPSGSDYFGIAEMGGNIYVAGGNNANGNS